MRVFLLSCLTLISSEALAGRGIPGPYVTEGKSTFTTDAFFDFDEEASNQLFRQRFTLDSGVTDQLSLRFRVNFNDPAGDNLEFDRFEIGGKYELAEKGEWPVDVGLYLTYIGDSGSNTEFLQSRILLAKDLDDYQLTSNIQVEREIGAGESNSDSTLSFNVAGLYKIDSVSKVGFDYFGNYGELNDLSNFNDNQHLFGPTYVHKLEVAGITLFTSGLFGLTDESPDFSLEWGINFSF